MEREKAVVVFADDVGHDARRQVGLAVTKARSSHHRADAETDGPMAEITIVEADFRDPAHAEAVVELLDVYAREPVEGGRGLSEEVKARLPQGLAEHPTAFALLALDGADAVGVAVCIGGFSTFAGRPLTNVHDLAVIPTHRGRGIGTRLLDAVTQRAQQTGCCKVTLEVRVSNAGARRLYERLGFADAGGQPTQFLERKLP